MGRAHRAVHDGPERGSPVGLEPPVSSTLLDRPPPRVSTPPQPRPSRAPAPPRKRAAPRWVFPAALVLSALLHLIALLLLRFELELGSAEQPGDHAAAVERPIGLRVYDVIAVEDGTEVAPIEDEQPAPLAPTAPEMPPVVAPPAVLPPPAPRAADAPAAPRTRESVGERISPRMVDPRLWTRPELPAEAPLHPDEVVRSRVARSINAWNDSMRLAEQAAARAVDWTAKDGSGGRWGVSPDGIHLGSFTLPLPIQFSAPPGRRDDAAAAGRSWSETQAQRGRAEVQESLEARIKAIRERKEAERRDSTNRSGGT